MIRTASFRKTKDVDIREAFTNFLKTNVNNPSEFILSEFAITDCDARVDVAVFGDFSHGYEFKSDMDTLQRLYNQRDAYNAFFDKVTLVVGKTHIIDALEIIPDWWGVTLAKFTENKISFLPLRSAQQNPDQDFNIIANQLWKSEALSLLNKSGYSAKNKAAICEVISNKFPPNELKSLVNERIIYRYKYALAGL